MKKQYSKPTIEVLKADMETAINFGSIPVKPGTVPPGSSLAPKYDYLFEDEEDEE